MGVGPFESDRLREIPIEFIAKPCWLDEGDWGREEEEEEGDDWADELGCSEGKGATEGEMADGEKGAAADAVATVRGEDEDEEEKRREVKLRDFRTFDVC